jgi:hypothetical protein
MLTHLSPWNFNENIYSNFTESVGILYIFTERVTFAIKNILYLISRPLRLKIPRKVSDYKYRSSLFNISEKHYKYKIV